MKSLLSLLSILLVLIVKFGLNDGATNVKTIADHKEFKKLTRVDTNVLIYFFDTDLSSAELKSNLRILNEAANLAYGLGTIAVVDCRDNEGKKLCKKLKAVPTTGHYLVKHYSNGEFHKDYDRQLTAKSISRFLSDPQGEIPWEEEPSAKSVRHIESAEDFNKMVTSTKGQILVMFYAPWCGHCKAMKPQYSAAADELKRSAILAAVDVTRPGNSPIASHFNVKGYPTLIYFNEGSFQMNYAGERTKEGIIAWLKNPTAEKENPEAEEKERDIPWSETVSDVVHLTDETFDSFIAKNPSTLVMFYAPWCGHCKRAKPEYEKAAARLAEKNGKGVFAAVDATIHKKAAEKYNIEGFPTFKYFQDGDFAWDVNERTADGLYEFMLNPTKPPEPEQAWSEMETRVVHLDSETFKANLKKKRHALVLFYSPWNEEFKTLRTQFTDAAEKFADDSRIVLAAVDCSTNIELCKEQKLTRLPIAYYFSYLKDREALTEPLTKDSLVAFISKKEKAGQREDEKEEKKKVENAGGFDFHENVATGTSENFAGLIETGRKLVMFYAPWCGHCKHAKPAFSEAAQALQPGDLIAVDCTLHTDLCTQQEVRGYPTFKIFENGKFVEKYSGGRTKADFIKVISASAEAPAAKPQEPEKAGGFDFHENVAIGTNENFGSLITTGRKLAMFYAPWCGHCKHAKPAFSEAAQALQKGDLIAVDCTLYKDLCAQHEVRGYPTFKIFENGKFLENYNGGRTKADFVKAIGSKAEAPAAKPQEPEKAGGFDFHENVAIGTNENFGSLITTGRKLAMFYAPWCGHCKHAKPAFSEAAQALQKGDLIAVDCTVYKDLCSQHEVRGFPTFKIFENGKFLENYNGGRTKADFVKAINPTAEAPATKPPGPPSAPSGFDFDEKVKIGNNQNFDELVTSGLKSLVMFYAPWCGHCKSAKPAFNEAAKKLSTGQLIAVDCTVHKDLCQRFNVRGYPTFKVFESGTSPEDYKGNRDVEGFLAAFNIKQAFFDEAVKEGTQENFEKLITKGKSFVMFYAPWCGHCKQAKPAFNDAAKEVKYVQFIGVDCTVHQDLCRGQKIGGYPSFKVLKMENSHRITKAAELSQNS